VLHCVAACCSVLLRVLKEPLLSHTHVAAWCSVMQYVAVCCRVLQCVAVCCSVLQRVAVSVGGATVVTYLYCSVLYYIYIYIYILVYTMYSTGSVTVRFDMMCDANEWVICVYNIYIGVYDVQYGFCYCVF